MSTNKKRDPEATRRAILRAAAKLFVDRGFAATSMTEIARAAHVTKSLIHHHFGSKEQLWVEVKRKLLAHYAEEQSDVYQAATPGGETLRKSVETLFEFLRGNPDFVRLSGWVDLEKKQGLAGMAYPELVSTGLQLVEQEQAAGNIRADLEPKHIIAALVSLCSHWFRARREFDSMYEGDVSTWDSSYLDAICKILECGVQGPGPLSAASSTSTARTEA